MKKNLLVLAIAVLLIGCSKFEEPPSDTPIRESKTRSALAAQDNPYSLTNVQMAMDKVSVEMGQPTIKLKPTHYYITSVSCLKIQRNIPDYWTPRILCFSPIPLTGN